MNTDGGGGEQQLLDPELSRLVTIFRRRGWKRAEAALLDELEQRRLSTAKGGVQTVRSSLEGEQQTVRRATAAVDSVDLLCAEFETFQRRILTSPNERCKPELSAFLFPVFALVHLKYVLAGNCTAARQLCSKFAANHEPYWQPYVSSLRRLTSVDEVGRSSLAKFLLSKNVTLRLSLESEREMGHLLSELSLLQLLIRNHLVTEGTDEPARSYETMEMVKGCLLGEAPKLLNRSKVYYGVFKDFSALSTSSIMQNADNKTAEPDQLANSSSRAAKKKSKGKDSSGPKKFKADPNAPPWTRIPFPVLSEAWRLDRQAAMVDANKKHRFLADNRPSVYFYTISSSASSPQTVCSLNVSDDSSLFIAGFDDCSVRVQKLNNEQLKCLKTAAELSAVSVDSDDLDVDFWDESSAQPFVRFVGHSGPVFGVSCNDDKQLIVSCSEDATVRLWSLQLRQCLVTYRYGLTPILDVQFGPFGGYFATADLAGGAYVWMVEKYSPVRLLGKHFGPVNSIIFHPNSNYVATASSDRSVRMWDLTNGQCVRLFTGHKNSVHSLCFSPDGRTLASGCSNGVVNLWDIGQGRLAQSFQNHNGLVSSLTFSRDNSTIVSGGLDEQIVTRYLLQSSSGQSDSLFVDCGTETKKACCSCSYRTKDTPVQMVHFTRRNLVLGFGAIKRN